MPLQLLAVHLMLQLQGRLLYMLLLPLLQSQRLLMLVLLLLLPLVCRLLLLVLLQVDEILWLLMAQTSQLLLQGWSCVGCCAWSKHLG